LGVFLPAKTSHGRETKNPKGGGGKGTMALGDVEKRNTTGHREERLELPKGRLGFWRSDLGKCLKHKEDREFREKLGSWSGTGEDNLDYVGEAEKRRKGGWFLGGGDRRMARGKKLGALRC